MIDELNEYFTNWQTQLNHPILNKTKLVIKKDIHGACYHRLSNEIIIPPYFFHMYHIDIIKGVLGHEIGHVILNHKEKDNFYLANKASNYYLSKHSLKIQGLLLFWSLLISFSAITLIKNIELSSPIYFLLTLLLVPTLILSSFYYLTKIPLIIKIIKPKSKKLALAEKIKHSPEFDCDLVSWYLNKDNIGLIAFLESVKSHDKINEQSILTLTHPTSTSRVKNLLNLKNKQKMIKKLYKLNLI